jgi:hypothetical protein
MTLHRPIHAHAKTTMETEVLNLRQRLAKAPAVRNMNRRSSIGLAIPANPRGRNEGLGGEELLVSRLVRHFESASRTGICSQE